MPFELYTRLLDELERPTALRLNYSGESGHYPRLIEALDAAKATGARVELVTALVSVPDKTVRAMAERLDGLTLSIHTTSETEFLRIYRFGSFAEFERKLRILTEMCQERGSPRLDFAFVAMESNISSLDGVVELARNHYIQDVSVQPVMRREQFDYGFPELDTNGHHKSAFSAALRDAVNTVQSKFSGVSIQVANPLMESCNGRTGEAEQIVECAEDPWQTVHIMSNGDVISCGWRQGSPVGNLVSSSLREIWHGPAYEAFRKAYRDGRDQACRRCHFKKTYPSAPLERRLTPANCHARQLPAGWLEHRAGDNDILWAGAQAVMEMPADGPALHLRGGLPPGAMGDRNALSIRVDGKEIAAIENVSKDRLLWFDRVLHIPKRGKNDAHTARAIRFATQHEYVPREHGHGGDCRRLGFCIELAECVKTAVAKPDTYCGLGLEPQSVRRLRRLHGAIGLSDFVAPLFRPFSQLRRRPGPQLSRPGLTVIIPERDSPDLLDQCLQSLQTAAQQWPEPLQAIVVVNGVCADKYRQIRSRCPYAEFVYEGSALTFCGAVRAGLKRARHDWVYLLNSDMILEPGALAALADERQELVFALASRICLADQGLLPYETNWTAYRICDGVLEVFHAAPPEGLGPFDILFGGGGCTMYRRSLLERYLGRYDPYAPFYFEDLEWATRGWRDGFRSLLCPGSLATHRHRATINKFYGPLEAERILERNRLQYQLRHVIEGVSREAVLRRIAEAGRKSVQDLTGWRTVASIAVARLKSRVLGEGILPLPYRSTIRRPEPKPPRAEPLESERSLGRMGATLHS